MNIFKFIFLITLLFLVFFKLDYDAIKCSLSMLDNKVIILTLTMMCSTIILCAIKWWLILKALNVKLKISSILNLYFASVFTNIVIPGAIGGEALKIWQLHKNSVGYEHALNSILIDKILTIVASGIVFFVFVAYVIFISNISIPKHIEYYTLFSTITIFFTVTIISIMNKKTKINFISKFITKFLHDSKLLLTDYNSFILTFFMSIAINCIYGIIAYYLTKNFLININIYFCLAMIPVVNIICYLPISYAGWGVREVAMIYAYSLVGIPKEIALTVSIIFGLQFLLSSLPGGLCFLSLNKQHTSIWTSK